MLGLRTAARASSALPVFRNAAARRFNSSAAKGLEGPADNAFNRERAAVKQHAADTSGKWDWRWTEGIGLRGRGGGLGAEGGGLDRRDRKEELYEQEQVNYGAMGLEDERRGKRT